MATTLYSPTGDKYETGSTSEITRLKSRGYTEKKPTPTQIKVATGEAAPKN
jgi:hypothetical protein